MQRLGTFIHIKMALFLYCGLSRTQYQEHCAVFEVELVVLCKVGVSDSEVM